MAAVRRGRSGAVTAARLTNSHPRTYCEGVRVRAVALVVVCGMASGCLHSATPPPLPALHPGGQAVPAPVEALLNALPSASRPTGTASVSASMPIAEHGYAGRSLVLVAYPARDGACVVETYVT